MFIKLFAIALPLLFAADIVWLGIIAKNFYAQQIGFLMRPDIQWPAAILFYLLYIAGLVFFVILPARAGGSWLSVLASGALFGLIAYATYDLSNLATLKGWPVVLTIADLAWGAVLSGTVSLATFLIANILGI